MSHGIYGSTTLRFKPLFRILLRVLTRRMGSNINAYRKALIFYFLFQVLFFLSLPHRMNGIFIQSISIGKNFLQTSTGLAAHLVRLFFELCYLWMQQLIDVFRVAREALLHERTRGQLHLGRQIAPGIVISTHQKQSKRCAQLNLVKACMVKTFSCLKSEPVGK